jgi:glycosyl transferase, family 25
MWGLNFDSMLLVDLLPRVSAAAIHFHRATMRQQLDRFQGLEIEPRAVRLISACGTLCYAVSARAARKLLAGCTPIRPILLQDAVGARTRSVDYGVDHAIAELYPRIQAYAAVPPVVVSPNELTSSTVQIRSP